MCTTFHLKNGDDIETVEQFEMCFNVDAYEFINPAYKDITKDACLCQIDEKQFFKKHPEIAKGFKCEYGMDYWEL